MWENTSMSYVADVLLAWTEHALPIHLAALDVFGSEDLASNPSVATLLLLHRNGPQRPTRIASLTGLTSGGATKLITRLEEAGFVVREQGAVASDGRAVVVSLTDIGSEKMDDFTVAMTGPVDAFVSALVAIRDDA
jgi:DNA-binding MarR family transcriptional regulator